MTNEAKKQFVSAEFAKMTLKEKIYYNWLCAEARRGNKEAYQELCKVWEK